MKLPRRRSRSAPTTTPAAWCCSSRARSTPSPATTPCSPAWPPRTRTRSCPTRRPSPPSRTAWASTPTTSTSSGSSTPAGRDAAATASGPRSTTAGCADALGPAPAPPKAGVRQDAVTVTQPAVSRPGRRCTAPAAPGPAGYAGRRRRRAWPTSTRSAAGATTRRRELDQLDQAALTADRTAPALTGDITLSMALWKAVSDRYELLLATWDSGRVGPTERERLATLIWGRLDAPADPADASRASARVAARGLPALRRAGRASSGSGWPRPVRRWRSPSGSGSCGPSWSGSATRSTSSRPGGRQQQAAERQARLARRLDEIADKAGRGGDVGGLLGPLEIEAATFERDLIVGGAQRREAGAQVDRARDAARRPGGARGGAASSWSTQLRRHRRPGPALRGTRRGRARPGAQHRGRVEAYLRRLDQVARAMTHGAGRVRARRCASTRSWSAGSRPTAPRPRPLGVADQAGPVAARTSWPGRRSTGGRPGWRSPTSW